MNGLTKLEQSAVQAHAAGMPWAEFWELHRHAVGAIQPWDNAAYRRIVARLTALVAAGDLDGQPIADSWPRPEPWELDDAQGVPG